MNEKAADQDSSNVSFFDSIAKLLPRNVVQDTLRLTSSGVFVHESSVGQIIETYRDWLQKASGSSEKKSVEKVERRLFGDGERRLFYVLDGKKCLPGFVMHGGVTDPQKAGIPRYSANLMDTTEYLHPRDPYLQSLPGLHARLTPKEGFVLELAIGKKRLLIEEATLAEFARVLRRSTALLADFPGAEKTLRGCILPLQKLFEQARELPPEQRLLVPERFSRQQDLRFLRFKTLVFLVEGNRLKYCYEIKGKGLRGFIRKELTELSASGKLNVKGFEAKTSRPQYLGKLWQKGISFHLHSRAFSGFLLKLPKAGKLKKKLPPRLTLKQALERFVPIFQSASPVEEREIFSFLGPKRKPHTKYRRNGSWLFVIVDKNVVEDCLLLPHAAPAHGSKTAHKQNPNF